MPTKCKPAKIKNSMDMNVCPMDDSMDMNLSKFQDIIRDRRTLWASVHGVTKSGTQFSNGTTKTMRKKKEVKLEGLENSQSILTAEKWESMLWSE